MVSGGISWPSSHVGPVALFVWKRGGGEKRPADSARTRSFSTGPAEHDDGGSLQRANSQYGVPMRERILSSRGGWLGLAMVFCSNPAPRRQSAPPVVSADRGETQENKQKTGRGGQETYRPRSVSSLLMRFKAIFAVG